MRAPSDLRPVAHHGTIGPGIAIGGLYLEIPRTLHRHDQQRWPSTGASAGPQVEMVIPDSGVDLIMSEFGSLAGQTISTGRFNNERDYEFGGSGRRWRLQ